MIGHSTSRLERDIRNKSIYYPPTRRKLPVNISGGGSFRYTGPFDLTSTPPTTSPPADSKVTVATGALITGITGYTSPATDILPNDIIGDNGAPLVFGSDTDLILAIKLVFSGASPTPTFFFALSSFDINQNLEGGSPAFRKALGLVNVKEDNDQVVTFLVKEQWQLGDIFTGRLG